jgi:hypothetical protein
MKRYPKKEKPNSVQLYKALKKVEELEARTKTNAEKLQSVVDPWSRAILRTIHRT